MCGAPGHVDSHILVCGSGEDTEQLVEDGGQEVDHHMTLHCVETLEGREEAASFLEPWYLMRHEHEGVSPRSSHTFRYFTSSPSGACSDISML